MNYPWRESFFDHSSSSRGQDILIKRILLTHDPEKHDLDCEMLVRVIEAIMHHATPSQVSAEQDSFDVSGIEVQGAQEPSGNSVYKIACKILCMAHQEKNEDASTLSVLKLLGCYRWDEKLILALIAFATVYGKFCVIMQSQNQNSMAASIAVLQHLPKDISKYKPIFTAFASLVRTMLEVIRCVTEFEHLPITYVELQDDMIKTTKSLIYLATYWVVRSTMVAISLVRNLRDIKDEDPISTSLTVWEITTLKSTISAIGTQLRTQVVACKQETEQQMHKKLVNIFQQTHTDNQEVLRVLFAFKNDLPLKRTYEQAKLGISSLENKVVILLISRPELLPVEELFFLVHQIYDNPLYNKLEGTYDIVWFPIAASKKWSNDDIINFTILSNSLPLYSIRKPWSISSTTINYAKEEWSYEEEPIMVVLDSSGVVTNLNASDMVWIWGVSAYPFSTERERDLWDEEKWSLRLLLNNINPLLSMWVEEGRTICIYGSSKVEWIREFCATIKDIRSLFPQLEVVYVGKKLDTITNIVSVIEKERLSNTLSMTKINFFWHRLSSMRRSKVRLGETSDTDYVLREVESLLLTNQVDKDEDWMIIGKGFSTNIIRLHTDGWTKFLGQYPIWKKYLPKIQLVDAIKLSLKPPPTKPCSDSRIISYNQGLMEEQVICEKCKHPVEKFIVYDAME